jgi:hypothetical protein
LSRRERRVSGRLIVGGKMSVLSVDS